MFQRYGSHYMNDFVRGFLISYSSRLLVLKSCNIVERLVCVLCVQPSFGLVLDVAAREYLYIAKRRCPLRDFHWLSFAVSSRFRKGLQREAQTSQSGFGAKGRQEDALKSTPRKCCISRTKKSGNNRRSRHRST